MAFSRVGIEGKRNVLLEECEEDELEKGLLPVKSNSTKVNTSAETLITTALRSLPGPFLFRICEPESDRKSGSNSRK